MSCRIAPVAERVELLQAADRAVEHALAALALDIVLQIAGHRGDDLDAVRRQKFGEVLLARLLQDGEVAAVHHLDAELARAASPAGGNCALSSGAPPVMSSVAMRRRATKVEHHVGDLGRHLLGAVRPGIDVAMEAGLVAAIADIDLQRVELAAADARERALSSSGSVSRMGSSLLRQLATAQRAASPRADSSGTNCREQNDACDSSAARSAVATGDSTPMRPISRQLDAGMAQIEPGDQAEQIDLDALDPAELHARRSRRD